MPVDLKQLTTAQFGEQLDRIENLLKPLIAGATYNLALSADVQQGLNSDAARRAVWAFNNSPTCTIYISYDSAIVPTKLRHFDLLAPGERKLLLSPTSMLLFAAEDPSGNFPDGILNLTEYF